MPHPPFRGRFAVYAWLSEPENALMSAMGGLLFIGLLTQGLRSCGGRARRAAPLVGIGVLLHATTSPHVLQKTMPAPCASALPRALRYGSTAPFVPITDPTPRSACVAPVLLLAMSSFGTCLLYWSLSITPQWRVAEMSVNRHYQKLKTGRDPMHITRFVDGRPYEITQEEADRKISDDEIRLRRANMEDAGISEEDVEKWRF